MARRVSGMGLFAFLVVACSSGPGREGAPDPTPTERASPPISENVLRRTGPDGIAVETAATAEGPVLDEPPLGVLVRLRAAPTFDHRAALRGTSKRMVDARVRTHRFGLADHHGRLLRSVAAKLGRAVVPRDSRRSPDAIAYEDFRDVINAVALHGVSERSVRKALSDDPEVVAVEPIVRVQASLNESVPLIDADDLWALVDPAGLPVDGNGMRIGIIDTGIDYTHPDLGGCLGPGCKVAGGHDFVGRDDDPLDDNGHGTHVASIAAGDGTYAGPLGPTPIRGVAPRARLYAYKVLGAAGSGLSTDVIAAIQRCADPNGDGDPSDHLDVCNLSLGGPGNPDDAISAAVDGAVGAGVVMAVAAGNSGPTAASIESPGTARRAITVAAECRPGSIGLDYRCTQSIASFSSRGPVVWTGADGLQHTLAKPDVAAPGVSVCAAEWGSYKSGWRCLDDRHVSLAGTSMAAPFVAGAAALLRQGHPIWTPDEVKAYLAAGALSLGLDSTLQGAGQVGVAASSALGGGIAEAVARIEGTPLLDRDDPTSRFATFASALAVTNITATPLTYSASFTAQDAGLTASVDPPLLMLDPGQTGTLVVTRQVDHDLAPSGAEVRGTVVLSTALGEARVPLAVGVRDRLVVTPAAVDLGVDLASQTTWTGQQTLQLSNTIGDAPVTYSASLTCCSAIDDPTPTGISAVLDRSSVTVPAGGSATLGVTVAAQNASLRTTRYSGTVHLSSPRQTLDIPVTFFKGYGLELHFGSEVPRAVAISSASLGSTTSVPTASSARYYLTQPGPYFVEATWYGSSPYLSQHVLVADLASDVPMRVATLDKSEAVYTLELRPVGPTGAAPTSATFMYRFTHSASGGGVLHLVGQMNTTPGAKVRVSAVPPGFNFTASMVARSSADILTFLYELPEGLTGDLILANTPEQLIVKDVRGFRSGTGTGELYLQPWACHVSSYRSNTRGYLPSSNTCYSSYPYATTLPPGLSTRVYFFNRAARDLLAAPFPDAPWIDFSLPEGSASGPERYRAPHIYARSDGIFAWDKGTIYDVADRVYDVLACGIAPTGSVLPLGNGPLVPAWGWSNFQTNVHYEAQRGFPASPYQWSGCVQEGLASFPDTTFSLYRDGALIASGPITPYTSVYYPGVGSHRLVLTRSAAIAGVTTQVETVSTFTTAAFPIADSNPPVLRSLHLVSRGAWQEVLDPAASSRLTFELDPGPGISGYTNGPVLMQDALASVTLEQSADGAVWTQVALLASGTSYQSTTLAVDPDAPLTWLRITAFDLAGNGLVHTFQVPKGTGYGDDLPDVVPPVVSLTAPAAGAIVSGAVQVTASAADDAGVARVDFYLDGSTLLGTASAAPYAVTWDTTPGNAGGHVLTARAFDLAGNAAMSAEVQITVDNAPPSVTLTAPAAGAIVSGTALVTASAADDAGIERVDFYADGTTPIGSASGPPYSVPWDTSGVQPGAHTLAARAVDRAGHATTSAAVGIVVADVTAPTISIISPANGSAVRAGGNVTIAASAADDVGVTRVQFFVGGVVTCAATTAPYTCSWRVPRTRRGRYDLSATAFDAAGNSSTSTIVQVLAR